MDRSRDWVLVVAAVVALAVWYAMRSSDASPKVPISRDGTRPSAELAATPEPNVYQRPSEGALAPDLTLETLEGEYVSLSNYRGKVVLVNFWASWCGPCRVEIPELQRVYEELAERGFEILAVNVGEDPSDIRGFVEAMDMRFPILLDGDTGVARAYALRGIPASFLVDQEGVIRMAHVGILTESMLRERVVALLGEDG